MDEWTGTATEAIALQETLRTKVQIIPLEKKIKTIAGVDVSLNLFSKDIYAGIIVLSYPDLLPLAHALVQSETHFPYIPGLLSFREIPALLQCWEKLSIKPDIIMVDGQGIAHPRRLGIASHLGVLLNTPTIGCAKSRLYGSYDEPTTVNQANPITDPKTGELLGTALMSKARSNPLIISPGHLVSVEDVLSITRQCIRGYRIPEPTRLAHNLVNAFRKGEIPATN